MAATVQEVRSALDGRGISAQSLTDQEIQSFLDQRPALSANGQLFGQIVEENLRPVIYEANNKSQELSQYINSLGGQVDSTALQQLRGQLGTASGGDFSRLAQIAAENFVVQQKQQQFTNPSITPEQSTTAQRIVQETLGETGDPDLIGFIADEIARGQSPYELKAFLQTTPQFQEQAAKRQQTEQETYAKQLRTDLNTQLLEQEGIAFNRAMPQILAQFARQGRIGSSGIDAAVARERGRLEEARQAQMASIAFQQGSQQLGFNRQDFLNQQNAIFGQSATFQAPYQDLNAAYTALPLQQFSRSQGLLDQRLARRDALDDYSTEQRDLEKYLNRARRQSREEALFNFGGQALNTGASIFAS